jgi:hypothetical protein
MSGIEIIVCVFVGSLVGSWTGISLYDAYVKWRGK